LAKDKGHVPLLGLGAARVVLATTRVGKGQLVVSGLAFDREWTSLTRLKAMVVLAQTLALGGRLQEASGLTLEAGAVLDAVPGKGEKVHIVSLVGDPLDWTGTRGQIPAFPRSGAYSVRVEDEQRGTFESFCLSVRSSDREGSGRVVESATVPALGSFPHTVRNLSEGDLEEVAAASRTGSPLYTPLLVLALLGLMVESLLGAPPLRRAGPAPGRKEAA
jgi:hypothetical protein